MNFLPQSLWFMHINFRVCSQSVAIIWEDVWGNFPTFIFLFFATWSFLGLLLPRMFTWQWLQTVPFESHFRQSSCECLHICINCGEVRKPQRLYVCLVVVQLNCLIFLYLGTLTHVHEVESFRVNFLFEFQTKWKVKCVWAKYKYIWWSYLCICMYVNLGVWCAYLNSSYSTFLYMLWGEENSNEICMLNVVCKLNPN